MNYKTASTKQLSHIKSFVRAPHKYPRECITEGLRASTALLASSYPLIDWYATPSALERYGMCLPEETLYIISERHMASISAAHTPSGIIARFHIPLQRTDIFEGTLVLAKVQDPGNMGTLMRTAVALGKRSICIVEGCYPWSPKVVQSSAGTIGSLTIIRYASWQELLSHAHSFRLIALDITPDAQGPEILDGRNDLLVVGNEGHGLPEDWRRTCTHTVRIPMPGPAESLNVAVAGSLALYLACMHPGSQTIRT